MENTRCVQGKPHKLEMFPPLITVPWLAPIFCIIFGMYNFTAIAISSTAAFIASTAIIIVSIKRTAGKSWEIQHNVLHFTQGISDKCDLTLRLDRVSSCEIADNPIYSLFRGTRVKLYSYTSPRPIFSMIMPQKQAYDLVNLTAAVFGGEKIASPRSLIQKKYSALLTSITSRESLIPLFCSAILCIFGWGKTELYIIATALWLMAVLHAIFSICTQCRMSVRHVDFGYAVQTGLHGGHRIFIPERAIIGVIETRNPIAALCGAGKFELLCAGGRKITCIGWYDGENSAEVARRIIGCTGKKFAQISSPDIIKKFYFKKICLYVTIGIAAWCAALLLEYSQSVGICMFIITESLLILHSYIGMKCSSEFGVNLSNGTLQACGMTPIIYKSMTLHTGQVAIIKIRKNFNDRLRNTCTAEIIPKGRERGVKCRCLPYERFLAACDRII